MLRNKLNPSTTYRWFLATRVPDDVKEKLAKGQIGYNLVLRIAWNRKKATQTNQGLLLIEELRAIKMNFLKLYDMLDAKIEKFKEKGLDEKEARELAGEQIHNKIFA